MNVEQVASIYDYLCANTSEPERLLAYFESFAGEPFSPVETVLYIPMYSWGTGAPMAGPRLNCLVENGWTLRRLAVATEDDIVSICQLQLGNGGIFGAKMQNRVKQIIQRAQEIIEFGEDNLTELLRPIALWTRKELVHRLRILQGFKSVGPAAALHILMDLHWNVVKPDRHICRFLSRLGGVWAEHFARPGIDTIEPHAFLSLQEQWRTVTTALLAEAPATGPRYKGNDFPAMRNWRPRHFDMIIMLYTQDIAASDRGWRPVPLCQSSPICDQCAIENCVSRAA